MYIYLGKYYHKSGKELSDLTEKKIGLTKDLKDRERNLNSTKFTLGYTIIRAWETGEDTFKIEKALHAILDNVRMEGEWFEDASNTLIGRVSRFMNVMGYGEVSLSDSLSEEENKVLDSTNKGITEEVVKEIVNKLNTNSLQYEQRWDKDKGAPYFLINYNDVKITLGIYSSGTSFYLFSSGKKSKEVFEGREGFYESSGKGGRFRIGEWGTPYSDDLKDLFNKLELMTNTISSQLSLDSESDKRAIEKYTNMRWEV